MPTVSPADVRTTDPPLPPPRVTACWAAELERLAALRGLPPDPWPL